MNLNKSVNLFTSSIDSFFYDGVKKANVETEMKALQLPIQTISLVAGFMVWVILSALMPFIKEEIQLSANQ